MGTPTFSSETPPEDTGPYRTPSKARPPAHCTAAPSLADIWCDEVHDALAEKLVISMKQAHDLAPDISDCHLYNEVRMKDSDYPVSTVRLSVSYYQLDHPSHAY